MRREEYEKNKAANPVVRAKEKSVWGDELHMAIEKGYLNPETATSLQEIIRYRETR